MTCGCSSPGSRSTDSVRAILASGSLRALFQPIVDLDRRRSSATRPSPAAPSAAPSRTPLELFAAARREGLLAELDSACRAQAFRSAVASGRLSPLTLFVNVEPEVLDGAPLDDLLEIARSAPRALRVVFEVTERGSPPGRRAAAHRRAHPRARLGDRARRCRRRPEVARVHVAAAARGRQARSPPDPAAAEPRDRRDHARGQRLCRELRSPAAGGGDRDEDHLATAHALGARFGQGWHFGRPSEQPSTLRVAEAGLTRAHIEPAPNGSAFDCLAAGTPCAARASAC